MRGPSWTGANHYVCALLDVGRVDDAVRTAEDLHARYPEESAAIAALAMIRLHQGRAAEAAVLAEAGTKRWAMRSLNWYCWGEALRVLGDPEAAITKFRRLYEQEFPSPECVTAWARALIDLGRNEEALAKFAEAEQLDHENARNYLRWGEALQRVGRKSDGDVMIAKAHALAAKQGMVL